jgi:MraZ protein
MIKLDDKNRVIMPPKTRPSLAGGVYLAKGQDKCLYLYSKPQFDAQREQNRLNPPPGMPPIAFKRMFFSSVVFQNMDKQGRVLVPFKLREYAGLVRDLALIVLEDWIEIWDAASWEAYEAVYGPMYAQLFEEG